MIYCDNTQPLHQNRCVFGSPDRIRQTKSLKPGKRLVATVAEFRDALRSFIEIESKPYFCMNALVDKRRVPGYSIGQHFGQ